MGILVITWNFPPKRGGVENLVAGLCDGLKRTHDLYVITSFARAGDQQGWVLRPRWPGIVPFFLYALWQGSVLLRRAPRLKVILGGSASVAPIVVILAKVFRRKAVINVHGLDLIYPSPLYQRLCVRWVRYCDRIIANSQHTATLAEKKTARVSSIEVIHPGINCKSFAPFSFDNPKKELGLEGQRMLLYVGRLVKRKGIKEFIERSLPSIFAEVPETCFVIVGGNPVESMAHRDDVLREIKATVQRLRLEKQVRLVGWLEERDLVKAYQASDLLVLPALSVEDDVEGFGIVILEAAAAGKPVVATCVGGIPDAIEHGKTGLLIEPGDYGDMSGAIIALLRDGKTRRELGEYARKRVHEEFDWQKVIKRYDEIFAALTAVDGQ